MVTFGSYITRHSNEDNGCEPAGFSEETGNPLYTGVKTVGACNNDIVLSVSDDGGASFTGTDTDVRELPTATSASRQRTTDQWFHWVAYTRDGKLATSYYDRQYGDDELTGWSDFSLSGSRGLDRFGVKRVTSSSMPPRPSSPAASSATTPAWPPTASPTRPGPTPATRPRSCAQAPAPPGQPAPAVRDPGPQRPYNNDQEIYTAAVSVPAGPGTWRSLVSARFGSSPKNARCKAAFRQDRRERSSPNQVVVSQDQDDWSGDRGLEVASPPSIGSHPVPFSQVRLAIPSAGRVPSRLLPPLCGP